MSTALGERPVAWRGVDAPRPLEAEPDRDRWGPVVAWLIAVAGPWGWALRTGTPRPAVAALLLVATAAVAASRRLRPTAPTTIGAALLAGAAATAAAGPITGAWLATTIVTSRVVAPPPDRPLWTTLPRQARIAAAVLAVIAGTNAALGHTPIAVALAAIATTLVPLLLGRHGALAWVDRFAHAVGRVLTSVLFSILAVFLVLIPHGLSRLFRTDPLATPGHWDHPPRPRSTARAAWADDRPRPARVLQGRHLAWRKALRASIIPLALLVVAGAVWYREQHQAPPRAPFVLAVPTGKPVQEPKVDLRNPAPSGLTDAPVKDGEVPAAVAGDAWWSTAEFQEAQSYTVKPGGVWHYENPYRALDFRSKYINVIDGLRKSWRPPACDCRRLKVWVYGGSTAWGIGQRDDHTIPSELARVAHEHGMTIDVDNRGLPGDHHWIEAERLAYDLTIEPPPDLVVFYDGVNDRWWERGLHDRIFDEIWIQSGRSQGRPPRGRTGSRIMPPPTLDSQGLQLTAEGVRRWDLARKMSKATSKATGVPVRYIWQPERYSRPFEPTEPHFDTRHENDARKASQFAEENLAPDVIDLTRALDRTKGPIYTDDAHHNERGARVIAEAMFAALQDDLRAIEAKA